MRSRIVKHRGVICALEEPGPANAETRVELLEHRAGLARYRLTPTTGRTHQLRLHMSGLGVPILGDDFYPELRDRPLDDFRRPLQLLAATLEFTDPVDGTDPPLPDPPRAAGVDVSCRLGRRGAKVAARRPSDTRTARKRTTDCDYSGCSATPNAGSCDVIFIRQVLIRETPCHAGTTWSVETPLAHDRGG